MKEHESTCESLCFMPTTYYQCHDVQSTICNRQSYVGCTSSAFNQKYIHLSIYLIIYLTLNKMENKVIFEESGCKFESIMFNAKADVVKVQSKDIEGNPFETIGTDNFQNGETYETKFIQLHLKKGAEKGDDDMTIGGADRIYKRNVFDKNGVNTANELYNNIIGVLERSSQAVDKLLDKPIKMKNVCVATLAIPGGFYPTKTSQAPVQSRTLVFFGETEEAARAEVRRELRRLMRDDAFVRKAHMDEEGNITFSDEVNPAPEPTPESTKPEPNAPNNQQGNNNNRRN